MVLVFASGNEGKLREINSLLPVDFRAESLAAFTSETDIAEPYFTFAENAMHKAKEAFRITGLPSFADDSGLEVRALGGKPGVFSARYAGEKKDPSANNEKLLREMENVAGREARFRTVIAFYDGKNGKLFEGVVEGRIAHSPRGSNGFGYDPLFIPGNSDRTFAEMELAEKNRNSHRAKAFAAFLGWLKTLPGQ
ncbi:MAG TPA: RdgB/HAM1 family non-canonical purine NTP pyrophosphatase [Bacteroidia bacterium]|nr:RdgB/HAM1 family non-canonical purine NTP pyrophosphatase [Bacteroidia bacterium]